jgi:cysteinyl-tRNA synthetase
MALKLYNTLTRQTEELVPLHDNEVRMYTCGPTVYHYVHIGNFRTFLFQDLLRRYLLYKGYVLKHVMNITDVEDKIIASAQREGVSIQEYTQRYETAFFEDMDSLRIQRPEFMPRATEHIEEMLELVEKLQGGSFAYTSNGSTYYRIEKRQDYGKLSRLKVDDDDSPMPVEDDDQGKEHPNDFVLWKARKEGETYWDSPIGPGRPGWHLECSAMSMKYLGETFDLHCGGIDLVFPHHENEIAQSEAATGKPFVRHWVHGAHLIVEGQKMSKSLGNFFTLRDLVEQGCNPLALRYLLLSVHYRKQLNFTFDGVEQANSAIERVNNFLQRIREIKNERNGETVLLERVTKARRDFERALDNDLNTSAALAAVFELVREGNLLLERGEIGTAGRDEALSFFVDVNKLFDVFQIEDTALEDSEISALIDERKEARLRKDFERADEIRVQLEKRGVLLEDTKDGTRWKRRLSQ